MTEKYVAVTEIAGATISQEQLQRICNRYIWASTYCENKDVIEVACGSGPGLGLLRDASKSLRAGDYSKEVLAFAKAYYGDSIALQEFDAQKMPFKDASADVILLFEAIYYIPDATKFVAECQRILRPGGYILIATANKDLYDFNPSPMTHKYYGVKEMQQLLAGHVFTSTFFGDTPVSDVSFKQKIFRPLKKIAVSLNLVPKSMLGKQWLKQLVFGELIKMPNEITLDTLKGIKPTLLTDETPDRSHKVIFCAAQKSA